jgi:hypothetical protein
MLFSFLKSDLRGHERISLIEEEKSKDVDKTILRRRIMQTSRFVICRVDMEVPVRLLASHTRPSRSTQVSHNPHASRLSHELRLAKQTFILSFLHFNPFPRPKVVNQTARVCAQALLL